MNKFKTTITIILLSAVALSTNAQVSDYQIKQEYDNAYRQLKSELKTANSFAEYDSLNTEIDSLRAEFRAHESIINHAVYPESFEQQIAELRNLAQHFTERQLVIENMNERLDKLNTQLNNYQAELANLYAKTDSLRDDVQQKNKKNKNLTYSLEHYKKSMEERDRMMLNMVDSLFAGFRDLSDNEISEMRGEFAEYNIQNEENPLKFLQSVIQRNTQWIKSSKETLTTDDMLRMHVIQHRFSEVWNKIGDNLVAVYGQDNPRQWKNNIQQQLNDWRATTSRNMWRSIDRELAARNLDLEAFDNNESFYRALNTYIKQATDSSRAKVMTNGEYQDFQAFYDFWNSTLKKDWGDLVQEGEVLTINQISAIDSEMMEWKEASKPKSFFIPVLLVGSLLLIVVLIIVLARRPNKIKS